MWSRFYSSQWYEVAVLGIGLGVIALAFWLFGPYIGPGLDSFMDWFGHQSINVKTLLCMLIFCLVLWGGVRQMDTVAKIGP